MHLHTYDTWNILSSIEKATILDILKLSCYFLIKITARYPNHYFNLHICPSVTPHHFPHLHTSRCHVSQLLHTAQSINIATLATERGCSDQARILSKFMNMLQSSNFNTIQLLCAQVNYVHYKILYGQSCSFYIFQSFLILHAHNFQK